MNYRKILFLRELQSNVRNECDACHKHKLLEYLAMDENNTMFTVCKECSEHLKKIMDAD
jgi:formate dehydrogenase maturation protein FdhE